MEQLFFTRIPGTSYREVVHVANYAAKPASSTGYGGRGSGQIRTNQFLKGFVPGPGEQPWMLKELKLAVDCSAGASSCILDAVPIPVKVNPDGNLWNGPSGLASDFQTEVVLEQVDALAAADINKFSYQVPVVYDAGRSQSQSPPPADHYFNAYQAAPATFKSSLSTRAGAHSLTDVNIVNRAAALSCAGCHQPAAFGLTASGAIGGGLSWPDSLGFVHVDVDPSGTATEFPISPALVEFLKARKANFAKILSDPACMCRFRRPGLPDAKLDQFERDVSPTPPRDAKDLADREKELKRKIDRELQTENKPRLPDLEKLDGPQIELDEVRNEPDQSKRGAARARAIQKLVREEPPRKTITGHFRTH